MAKRKEAGTAQRLIDDTSAATPTGQERQPGDEPPEQRKGEYKPVRAAGQPQALRGQRHAVWRQSAAPY